MQYICLSVKKYLLHQFFYWHIQCADIFLWSSTVNASSCCLSSEKMAHNDFKEVRMVAGRQAVHQQCNKDEHDLNTWKKYMSPIEHREIS